MTTAWSCCCWPGDLFDSDQLYGQTAQELAQSLARFRGHAVIAPGNHDFYAASSPYARLLWPENVHIFREERLQRLPLPPIRLRGIRSRFPSPPLPPGSPALLTRRMRGWPASCCSTERWASGTAATGP